VQEVAGDADDAGADRSWGAYVSARREELKRKAAGSITLPAKCRRAKGRNDTRDTPEPSATRREG
jgi:hypothetical protein